MSVDVLIGQRLVAVLNCLLVVSGGQFKGCTAFRNYKAVWFLQDLAKARGDSSQVMVFTCYLRVRQDLWAR